MLKALIFDMDGVMVNTMPYHREMNTELAEAIGCVYDEEMHKRLKGLPRRDILADMISSAGKAVTEELIDYYSDFKDQRFVAFLNSIDETLINPGILELIQICKAMSIKIGVASGSSNAERILAKTGLIDYVDYIADIHILKKGKPDPEIFEQVLNEFNVDASEVIGFEDGAPGIRGFNDLGIYAVGIGDAEELKEANLIVQQTGELKLEQLHQGYSKWLADIK